MPIRGNSDYKKVVSAFFSDVEYGNKPFKGELCRRPALFGAGLEHTLSELQKRAVRAADHGAAFGAPFVLKAAYDLVRVIPWPFPAE